MKSINTTIIIAAIAVALQSCNHKQGKQTVQPDTLLSKTISFPRNLLVLDGKRLYGIDSLLPSIKGKPKVITIVDGNCMSCVIGQLNKLDSIFHGVLHGKGLFVCVLIVQKKDSIGFMRNLQPSIRAKGIILWDNGYKFERYNKLLTPDFNLRTFMVDGDNKIVQYGNPLFYPNLLLKYEEKVANLEPFKQ